MQATDLRVGVDVGGTFTDLISFDAVSGKLSVAKVPSTPADQSQGFIAGLARLDAPLDRIDALVHGTTVGTNAVLERKGARCGLITTRGFRDVLELARRTRPQLYGLVGTFEPLIPRELRREVGERIDAEGNIVEPLDESGVRAAIEGLHRAGAETLVIHFLHSYVNPEHERRAASIARALWPNSYVTAGHEILREVREFERGTAAALNAYIQPIMARYIGRLSSELGERGFARDLQIMQGNGGMIGASLATERTIQTLMSGPAAGAIATAVASAQAGFRNVVGCDMGGTSFDVTLVRDGSPAITAEKDLDYAIPIRVPMVDIHAIGSGGGSIARIDRAGILRVGPESAGAVPGSICYGRGGEEPTVTDANLLLGRVGLDNLTGVAGRVDADRVRRFMAKKIAEPLGLDIETAAAAILTVVNHQMANAIRLVSIEKGCDPRDFALFAFGGAGPLHAVALARELDIPTVLVPRFPGITSALGCIVADVRHDTVRHFNRPLDDLDPREVDAIFADHVAAGHELLRRERIPLDQIDAQHEIDILYAGQVHMFRIGVAAPGFDPARVAGEFAKQYRQRFDIELPGIRPVLANLRTAIFGRRRPLDLGALAPPATAAEAPRRLRPVWFNGSWIETPVARRETFRPGEVIVGPAIVEQLDTTIVVEPGATARVDRQGNLVIDVKRASESGNVR